MSTVAKPGDTIAARHLDRQGRCCGALPIVHNGRLFCKRCNALFDQAGTPEWVQVSNWAWVAHGDGTITCKG